MGTLNRIGALLIAAFAGLSSKWLKPQYHALPQESHNGGTRSGVAASKRAALKRRNIRKHPHGSK